MCSFQIITTSSEGFSCDCAYHVAPLRQHVDRSSVHNLRILVLLRTYEICMPIIPSSPR